MSLRLGSTRIPGITLYEEGKVYPKGLVNIDASVPAPLATRIVNVGELSAKRNRTTYNGIKLTANSSFTFDEGDTLSIEVYGEMTGSTIYEDGVLIGSCDINEPYIYSLPNHAINFETFSTSSDAGGEVYITTVYGYDVTNYAFANVTGISEPIDYFTQYATDTLVSYSNSNVTSLPDYAFYGRSNLKEVNFPTCQAIGNYAFQSCSALTSINFPVCTSISGYAFYSCYKLTSANFPACTKISQYAFLDDYSLTSISFPACTTMGNYAFYGCSSLTVASFPSCTSIGNYAFYSCKSLTVANFPSCTTIGNSVFQYCRSLASISFPVCTSIGNAVFTRCSSLSIIDFPVCSIIGTNAFGSCYSLTSANFPSCKSIGSEAFRYCYNLLSLYLTGSSLCSLANINAFSSTPISNYTTSTGGVHGLIWVPESLYSLYISSTNWVNYSDRIVIFEG